jgi:hypothetical protein
MELRSRPPQKFTGDSASQHSLPDLSSQHTAHQSPNKISLHPAPFRLNTVENNEQRLLLGSDLNSRTPMWQHDNSCIRIPAQFIRSITVAPSSDLPSHHVARSSPYWASLNVPGGRPENVENNEQRPLLGANLYSRTPIWQHDNSWIRLPAQFVRWLPSATSNALIFVITLPGPAFIFVATVVESLVSPVITVLTRIFEYIPRPFRIMIWFCLFGVMILNGSLLGISLSRKESPSVFLAIEATAIFLWAVLTRTVTSRYASPDG